MDLSYNNYFKQSGNGSSWTVHLDKCKNNIIDSFTNECIRSAKLVEQTALHSLTILFSGGIDSEFMIRVFQSAGIKFNVAIIDYGHWNEHDTNYAYDFCKINGITPQVINVDVEDLVYSGEFKDIAHTAQCCAYQMIPVMKGITKVSGTVIMANGEPYFKNYDGIWKWQETERVNSYNRWYEINNIDGTPDFLRYTPEMVVAFARDPIIQELVENKRPGKLSTRTSKHKLYSTNYNFVPRQKYTGWEVLEESPIMEQVFSNIEDVRLLYNGVYEIEVKELLTSLI